MGRLGGSSEGEDEKGWQGLPPGAWREQGHCGEGLSGSEQGGKDRMGKPGDDLDMLEGEPPLGRS